MNRDVLITYLCAQQLRALSEACTLQDPEPEHYAMACVLEELESLGLRLPHDKLHPADPAGP